MIDLPLKEFEFLYTVKPIADHYLFIFHSVNWHIWMWPMHVTKKQKKCETHPSDNNEPSAQSDDGSIRISDEPSDQFDG